MRLRQTRVRTFTMRPRILTKDNEGVPYITYIPAYDESESGDESGIDDTSYTVKGYFWDGAGTRRIEEHGDVVENTASMRIEGEYRIALEDGAPKVEFADGRELHLNDGVYVYADVEGEPDYVVTKILEHRPLRVEVEHIGWGQSY